MCLVGSPSSLGQSISRETEDTQLWEEEKKKKINKTLFQRSDQIKLLGLHSWWWWWWFRLLVVSNLLWSHRLWPVRLFCPWDLPSRNTGAGYHFLLQAIFPTQGSNVGFLHCRQILYHWATREALIPGGASLFGKTRSQTMECLLNTEGPRQSGGRVCNPEHHDLCTHILASIHTQAKTLLPQKYKERKTHCTHCPG